MTWAEPPSLTLLLKEALWYGALFGGLVGSLTLFQGEFFGLPLGVGAGMVYGLCFALGGWTIGRLLVLVRVSVRKGLALGVGVVGSAALFLVLFSAMGGTLDPLLIITPCVVAAATGMWRGRHYDRGPK